MVYRPCLDGALLASSGFDLQLRCWGAAIAVFLGRGAMTASFLLIIDCADAFKGQVTSPIRCEEHALIATLPAYETDHPARKNRRVLLNGAKGPLAARPPSKLQSQTTILNFGDVGMRSDAMG